MRVKAASAKVIVAKVKVAVPSGVELVASAKVIIAKVKVAVPSGVELAASAEESLRPSK